MIKFCMTKVFSPVFFLKGSFPLYLYGSDNQNNQERRIVKCYNCGAPGHVATSCPEEPRCRNCRKPGHQATECTQPRFQRKVKCYNCGQEGHLSRDCPSQRRVNNYNNNRSNDNNSNTNRRERRCFICNDPGHIAPECPQKDSQPPRERRQRSAPRQNNFRQNNDRKQPEE